MRNNRRSVGCQHLLLALAAHILVEATPVRWSADLLFGRFGLGSNRPGASGGGHPGGGVPGALKCLVMFMVTGS